MNFEANWKVLFDRRDMRLIVCGSGFVIYGIEHEILTNKLGGFLRLISDEANGTSHFQGAIRLRFEAKLKI